MIFSHHAEGNAVQTQFAAAAALTQGQ